MHVSKDMWFHMTKETTITTPIPLCVSLVRKCLPPLPLVSGGLFCSYIRSIFKHGTEEERVAINQQQ